MFPDTLKIFPTSGNPENITLNLYIGIHGLAYERLLTVNVWSTTKFSFQKYCENGYIFYKNVPIKTILLVNPSPNYFIAYIQK